MSPARARAGWIAAAILGALLAAVLALAVPEMSRLYAEARLAAALPPPAATGGPAPEGWESARRRVVLIGDSRIARWRPLPEAPGLAVWVRGAGGETTTALRARFAADALGPRPDAVVLAAGINDMVAASLNPAAAGTVLETAAENLRAMAAEAREAGIPLVLAGVVRPARPDPLRRVFAWDGSLRGLAARLDAEAEAAAAAEGAVFLDADRLLAGNAPAGTPLPAVYAKDTLHLTAEAYRVLGGGLLASLDAALAPLEAARR